MRKQIVAIPGQQPSRILSRAVRFGNTLYIAGTTGRDPRTGQLAGNDMASQARQTLENIKTAIEAAGASMADVLKMTIYIVDMAEKQAFDDVYVTYFPADPPARACVQVAALGPGAKVEVETIAGMPD